MAKKKRKTPASVRSPLEIAASETITPETAARHAYQLRHFAERDFEGGVTLNGMRLERLACVKALEGLARSHPKRKKPFLDVLDLMAANAYHADILGALGNRSNEFRERIDISAKSEAGLAYRMDVSRKLGQIESRLSRDEKSVLDRVIVDFPDSSMTEIWPDRTQRNTARDLLKSALRQLAVIYGLAKH